MKDSAGFMQRTAVSGMVAQASPRGQGATRQAAGCAPALPLAHSVMLGQAQDPPRPRFPTQNKG